jgi:4,5-dihydroxyphthalate decarboxylase
MLLEGDIPAMISPLVPKPLLEGDKRIVRLFPDYVQRERDYFLQTGLFPIMHVTAIKQEIVDRHPWVPLVLMRAFEEAKQAAYRRMANVRVVPLPWFGSHWEEEWRLLGPDPWLHGLGAANRKNLDTIARYSHEQGLTSRAMTVDEMFVPGFGEPCSPAAVVNGGSPAVASFLRSATR